MVCPCSSAILITLLVLFFPALILLLSILVLLNLALWRSLVVPSLAPRLRLGPLPLKIALLLQVFLTLLILLTLRLLAALLFLLTLLWLQLSLLFLLSLLILASLLLQLTLLFLLLLLLLQLQVALLFLAALLIQLALLFLLSLLQLQLTLLLLLTLLVLLTLLFLLTLLLLTLLVLLRTRFEILLRDRLTRLVAVILGPYRMLLFHCARIAVSRIISLVSRQRCRCGGRAGVPMVPPTSTPFPFVTPVIPPMWRRIGTPIAEIWRRLAVVANRDAQQISRYIVITHVIPRPVVPAAHIPVIALEHPVEAVVKEVIRIHPGRVVDGIARYPDKIRVRRIIDADADTGIS